jgi:ketol-acid reductoisomerase
MFREEHADSGALRGTTIAILGYGLLGRPLGLNLRDALDARVIVGSDDDPSSEQARADGFAVMPLAEAAALADVALLLVPDEVQPAVLARIAPDLRPGALLVFASGYALAFGLVVPPPEVDVVLFAPRMGGDAIRERFLAGRGYLSYVGVEHDATGGAWPRLLALASGAGSLRQGALEMTARQEAVLDLYVEQACGPWLGAAILSAFHVGVEAGLPPLGLLLEMYLSGEMAETFAQMARDGFLASSRAHGYAAAFGGMTRTLAIDRESMAAHMQETLAEIENGDFAHALQDEFAAGYPCRTFLEEVIGDGDLLSRTEAAFRKL